MSALTLRGLESICSASSEQPGASNPGPAKHALLDGGRTMVTVQQPPAVAGEGVQVLVAKLQTLPALPGTPFASVQLSAVVPTQKSLLPSCTGSPPTRNKRLHDVKDLRRSLLVTAPSRSGEGIR